MRLLSRGRLFAGLALLLLSPAGRADDAKVEKVSFETVDEVTLKGTFYPSDKGSKAPCALLLHNVGGSSQQDGWEELAKQLQNAGFAVLTFDFRGHGDSTAVSPAFWKVSGSALIKGGGPKKSQISSKDFQPGYVPHLVDDIAAARRFLDEKNDAKQCNSSNLVVLGAQEGATLGALWLATEWKRRPPKVAGGTNPDPFGHDVVAAVWLSISPTLHGVPMKLDKWLGPLRDKTPMALLYGEDDKRTVTIAKDLCEQVLKVETPPRPKFTAAKGVKGKGTGHELLKVAVTDESILTYLGKVIEARGEPTWMDRDTKRAKVDFVPLKQFLP